jgi:hypothetical protein
MSTGQCEECPEDLERWIKHMESMGVGNEADERRAATAALEKVVRVDQDMHRKIRKDDEAGKCRFMGTASFTAFGIVGPGGPIPDGVPTNFHLKQEATMAFREGCAGGSKLGNFKGEGLYRKYFDDLVADRVLWLSFFDHRDHYEHAEHTCGILGTLATIYRQRGDYADCERVLNMEQEVLARYQRSSVGACSAQIECYEGLHYKYQHIRYNLAFNTERYDLCADLFRQLAADELRMNFNFEESNYLFMVSAVLNKTPTAKTLKALTDADMMRMVEAPLKAFGKSYEKEKEEAKQRVALRSCACCGKTEPSLRTFGKCEVHVPLRPHQPPTAPLAWPALSTLISSSHCRVAARWSTADGSARRRTGRRTKNSVGSRRRIVRDGGTYT